MARLKHSKNVPTIQDIVTVLQREHSDRALVLVCDAFLDRGIRQLIQTHFSTASNADADWLLDANGPLGSHTPRVKLAYALGLIGPKMRTDLLIIRELRNFYAHEFEPASLSDPKIRERLNDLQLRRRGFDPLKLTDGGLLSAHDGLRVGFAVTAAILAHQLLIRARDAKAAVGGDDYSPQDGFIDPKKLNASSGSIEN